MKHGSFLLRHAIFAIHPNPALYFPEGRMHFLRQLLSWNREIRKRKTRPWSRPERLTVILQSCKRPWNMEPLVRAMLRLDCIERVILSNNNPAVDMNRWLKISDPRLTVLHQPKPRSASMLGVLAASLARQGSEYFLSVDDDLLLFPDQMETLFLALLKNPSVPHGVVGQILENADTLQFRMHVTGESAVDVINRAYAFTAAHAIVYEELLIRLGHTTEEDRMALPFGGDIVLSACGSGLPLIHDVGPLLSCPTAALPGIARFHEQEFDIERRKLFRAIRSQTPFAAAWVCGQNDLNPQTNNVILLCRVRNGETYIPSFLEHYRGLGIHQMIFLDTGSDDRTMDLLRGHRDVTVFQTAHPFKTHRLLMRRWLMELCPPGTWTLNVDIDELFDYPGSRGLNLQNLAERLSDKGFTAMRAHMLDCFSDLPLDRTEEPRGTLSERYPWYDLSGIEPMKNEALFGNALPAFQGGIRKQVFGSPHFWLTKHPLIRTGHGVRAFERNEHTVDHAHLANVTGVLLHYKFTANFRTTVEEAIRLEQHWNASGEYRLYRTTLEKDPHRTLKCPGAKRYRSADDLVHQGLLTVSAMFPMSAGQGSRTSGEADGDE